MEGGPGRNKLEQKIQPELDLASSIVGRAVSEKDRAGSAETKLVYVYTRGRPKVRVIECVQQFCLEREVKTLCQRQRFADSDVLVEVTGTIQPGVEGKRTRIGIRCDERRVGAPSRAAVGEKLRVDEVDECLPGLVVNAYRALQLRLRHAVEHHTAVAEIVDGGGEV